MSTILSAFFQAHRGLGLGSGIDQVILQRIVFGQQQAGGGAKAGPDQEEWKAVKAELKALKGELTATKSELKSVKDKAPGGPIKRPGGEPEEFIKQAKCHNCGEIGHLMRDCQEPKKSRKELLALTDASGGDRE